MSTSRFIILIPAMLFLLHGYRLAAQYAFPPGSIWEFDHSQITMSGPFEGYSRWEATDLDTFYKGHVWQIISFFQVTEDIYTKELDTIQGDLFFRRDSLWLAGAGLPNKNDDRDTFRYIWWLDGEIPGPGQTFYTSGHFCPGVPISILTVDTVEVKGHPVQRYSYLLEEDTIWVYPYPGLVESSNSFFQHAHYGSAFHMPIPELMCVTDIGYVRLSCFTFPDGSKWMALSSCGEFPSTLDGEQTTNTSWKLLPNPSSGLIRLLGPDQTGTLTLRLFSVDGNQVATFSLDDVHPSREFDVSGFVPGWYLLEISGTDGIRHARIPWIKL